MQTEESPKFRLNIQVVAMLAVVLAALTVPVAGVIISAQRALKGSAQQAVAAPSPEAKPVSGLQGSLEGLADQVLLPVETMINLSIPAADPEPEVIRIQKLAEVLGGESVISRKEPPETVLMVKIPSGQAETFLKALKKTELRPASEGDVFFEVKIYQP